MWLVPVRSTGLEKFWLNQMFKYLVGIFLSALGFAITAPEFLQGQIETYEYENNELLHQSSGMLSSARDQGLKFEDKSEIYYLYQNKIYRYSKRLKQVIIYHQVPDVIKSISWLIHPALIVNQYQIIETGDKVTLKSYGTHETIVIVYGKNKTLKEASWYKDGRHFVVKFKTMSTQLFNPKQVRPHFSKDIDMINFGEQHE